MERLVREAVGRWGGGEAAGKSPVQHAEGTQQARDSFALHVFTAMCCMVAWWNVLLHHCAVDCALGPCGVCAEGMATQAEQRRTQDVVVRMAVSIPVSTWLVMTCRRKACKALSGHVGVCLQCTVQSCAPSKLLGVPAHTTPLWLKSFTRLHST